MIQLQYVKCKGRSERQDKGKIPLFNQSVTPKPEVIMKTQNDTSSAKKLVKLTKMSILSSMALLSVNANANDQDLWAKTVPASFCTPVSEDQANEVWLSNGALVFSGNNTGTISFYCPVSLNAYTVSNNSWDNDISKYRVYYRDTDGQSNSSAVTARLVYRRANGMYSAGGTFSSNGYSDTGNTSKVRNNAHDVRSSAHYAFLVTLRRTNTTQSPAFTGIDFPFPTFLKQ